MKQYLEKRGIYITWSQLAVRIIFDLVGFLLALLPAGLTLYLTDVWITSGTHMPTSWILGIIVCVFLIHFYQFYFVNYNSQMNADRMAGNYRQHLAQKILSSSIPAYESQNKARIQNMANDVSAIYTVSSYLVTVPANLVKVIIIIGLLLFYASPSVALTAIILIPLYMVPSFLNKSELERLVAKEREAGDLWFQEFDVILNGKVSITLNKVENYMQNRYNEALKSYRCCLWLLAGCVRVGAPCFFTMIHHFPRAASGILHQHGSGSDAAHPGIVPIFCAGMPCKLARMQCHFPAYCPILPA